MILQSCLSGCQVKEASITTSLSASAQKLNDQPRREVNCKTHLGISFDFGHKIHVSSGLIVETPAPIINPLGVTIRNVHLKLNMFLTFIIKLEPHSDGMKEFKCGHCDKTFKYLSLYQRHIRIHTSERDFTCHLCSKAFNRPDTLKTHMNIHTESGFACCGRFFHSKAALNYHQRSVHSVKVFKCRECRSGFHSQKDMEAHSKTHFITEFPMLTDCITTEQSSPCDIGDQLIFVVDEFGKKPSIWSQAELLLMSYIKA